MGGSHRKIFDYDSTQATTVCSHWRTRYTNAHWSTTKSMLVQFSRPGTKLTTLRYGERHCIFKTNYAGNEGGKKKHFRYIRDKKHSRWGSNPQPLDVLLHSRNPTRCHCATRAKLNAMVGQIRSNLDLWTAKKETDHVMRQHYPICHSLWTFPPPQSHSYQPYYDAY